MFGNWLLVISFRASDLVLLVFIFRRLLFLDICDLAIDTYCLLQCLLQCPVYVCVKAFGQIGAGYQHIESMAAARIDVKLGRDAGGN